MFGNKHEKIFKALVPFETHATLIKKAYRAPGGSSVKRKLIGYSFAGDVANIGNPCIDQGTI